MEAIDNAGRNAGEYLEELGKTDLSLMTLAEWREFLHVVVKNYHDA